MNVPLVSLGRISQRPDLSVDLDRAAAGEHSSTNPAEALRAASLLLKPVVDHESRSFGSAVEKNYFELLFSFLRTVIGYHLGCVACVLRALASDMNVGIPWPGASVRRIFRSTWSRMKRRCMRRITAFALAALCFATAPSCVKSQVCARDTCELGGY